MTLNHHLDRVVARPPSAAIVAVVWIIGGLSLSLVTKNKRKRKEKKRREKKRRESG
jgi:preprotein translocase subunit SecG